MKPRPLVVHVRSQTIRELFFHNRLARSPRSPRHISPEQPPEWADRWIDTRTDARLSGKMHEDDTGLRRGAPWLGCQANR